MSRLDIYLSIYIYIDIYISVFKLNILLKKNYIYLIVGRGAGLAAAVSRNRLTTLYLDLKMTLKKSYMPDSQKYALNLYLVKMRNKSSFF